MTIYEPGRADLARQVRDLRATIRAIAAGEGDDRAMLDALGNRVDAVIASCRQGAPGVPELGRDLAAVLAELRAELVTGAGGRK